MILEIQEIWARVLPKVNLFQARGFDVGIIAENSHHVLLVEWMILATLANLNLREKSHLEI
jgi:hypothetical protein